MFSLKRGNAMLVVVAVFTIVLGVGGFMVLRISQNVLKKTAAIENNATGRAITNVVSQNGNYQNPFETTAQTANPFEDYQNPFDDIK